MYSMLTIAGARPLAADLTLSVNLASYTLEVWDGSERIRSYPVTIGMNDFPTPMGSFLISRIEWNPSWVPPDRPWARGKQERGPGKNNPMGRVKLQFDDYLYVHGTSQLKQLGGAHSHGCVRLANADALELARLIALDQGVISSGEIAGLERNSRRTRSVRLARPIPLRIRQQSPVEYEPQVQPGEEPRPAGDSVPDRDSVPAGDAVPPGRESGKRSRGVPLATQGRRYAGVAPAQVETRWRGA
jgi:hypothetical protein